MSKPDAAQLISAIALGLMTVVLAIVHHKGLVAVTDGSYSRPDGVKRHVTDGSLIPRSDEKSVGPLPVRRVRRSALGAILAGVDHRTSTSKTVVLAWTLAVAFGLLSLVVSAMLGDHAPWDLQVDRGLQGEYLILLGGPLAAAVLARYATTTQAETKFDGPIGGAGPAQLLTNDHGDVDLGDFQYVLFNVIGLVFFLGDFIGDLSHGFPDLPSILTGLMLTSTGGYAAKKLLAQGAPTLISVLPAAAAPGGSVQIFGMNFDLPAPVSATRQPMTATVLFGHVAAAVTAHDIVLGNNRLTVTVPADAQPGSAPVSVARADGVQARDVNGVGVLAFEVLSTTTDRRRSAARSGRQTPVRAPAEQ